MKHFVSVKYSFDGERFVFYLIVARVHEVVQVINQGPLLNVQQAAHIDRTILRLFLFFLRLDSLSLTGA